MKYRVKKVMERIPFRGEHVYWCVQVHVFAWIWITVKTYRSDVFEREGQLEDYGEWLAKELKDKLEEEEE